MEPERVTLLSGQYFQEPNPLSLKMKIGNFLTNEQPNKQKFPIVCSHYIGRTHTSHCFKMASALLRSAVIALLSASVLSCSCVPSSFEKLYCSSKTSVRGKVIAKIDNCRGTCEPIKDQVNGQITYIIKAVAIYKGGPIEDKILYFKTAVNSALCGVTLHVGTVYLFNLDGQKFNRFTCPKITWSVGLCNFPTKFSNLSKAQRSFVVRNSRTQQSLCRRRASGFIDLTL